MSQNAELNIFNRVVVQLKTIDGTGDFNNNIEDYQIHEEYQLPEEAKHDIDLSMGDFSCDMADPRRRNAFEIPFTLTIWGYVKKKKDTYKETLKLLSDIRIAIGTDEFLNNLAHETTFTSDIGVMEDLGIIRFNINSQFTYKVGV